ncbi:MAG: class I SAM-dependent methyltransferase [Myxococcales bacterium]|nr:class I SAM-dependent methyltransferase [Myxococcales bacterium]
MVRLRREIEGIHLDRSVSPPPWATAELRRDLISPSWIAAIRALDASRLLFCGIVATELALERAAAGCWVTLTDLGPAEARQISASLSPDVASRLQLVSKSYGEATFAASSFDAVIMTDQLHAYDAPEWVVQKIKRELKVDGLLLARLHVSGDVSELPEDVSSAPIGPEQSAWQRTAIATVNRQLSRLSRSSAAAIWLDDTGLDAVSRGDLWSNNTTANQDLRVQLAALSSRLHLEKINIGSTARASALTWSAGSHPKVNTLALNLADRLPELADDADRLNTGARAVWIVARRALMNRGKAIVFGTSAK